MRNTGGKRKGKRNKRKKMESIKSKKKELM